MMIIMSSSASLAMNSSISANYQRIFTKKDVISKIDNERKNVVIQLRDKMNQTKFDLLKQYLVSEQINVPDEISTVKGLMGFAKSHLTTDQYAIVVAKRDNINSSIDNMITDLAKGSTSTFTENFKRIWGNIQSVGLTVLEPFALRTILKFLTPSPLKIFAGASLLIHSGYKIVKNIKKRQVVNQEYGLSKMIREMEITKDENGNIVDTRFDSEIQEEIRVFLKNNGVKFEDTGYISLCNAMYSLDFEKKKALCNLINNKLGNKINVEKRLKKYKGSFLNFSIVTSMGVKGLILANTINTIPLAREFLSTTILSGGLLILTGDKLVGVVTGVGKTSLSLIANVFGIDSLKDFLVSTDTAVNIATLSVGFSAIGLVGSMGMSLWNYLKGKKERVESFLENKEIAEIEAKKYAEDIAKEQMKIKKNMEENPDLARVMIVTLVCEFMIKKGIKIPENIKNAKQLVEFINTLDKEKKNEIMKFYDELKYYNMHNHGLFMKSIVQTLDIVGKVAIVGLAGFSIYDIFKNISTVVLNAKEDIKKEGVSDEVKKIGSDVHTSSSNQEHGGSGRRFGNDTQALIDGMSDEVNVATDGQRFAEINAEVVIEPEFEGWGQLNVIENPDVNLFKKSKDYIGFDNLQTNEERFRVLVDAINVHDRNVAIGSGDIDNEFVRELLSRLSSKQIAEFVEYYNANEVIRDYFGENIHIGDVYGYKELGRLLKTFLKTPIDSIQQMVAQLANMGVDYQISEKVVKTGDNVLTNAVVPLGLAAGIQEEGINETNKTKTAHFTREQIEIMKRLHEIPVTDEQKLYDKRTK